MKKRLTCLVLALLMILPSILLTSCGTADKDADDVDTEEVRSVATVDLWLPYYAGTTEESIQLVQTALNDICEEKYSTHLVLHFVADKDYENAILNRFDEIEANQILEEEESRARKEQEKAEKGAGAAETAATTTAVATETDEYGIPVVVYPEVKSTQMDIFLVRGYENYLELCDDGYLNALDADMSQGDPKILKSYIYPTFLKYAQIDGETYGVPNNRALGEYTFLLINKNCVETVQKNGVSVDPAKMTSAIDTVDFLKAVEKYCKGTTPVLGSFDYYGLHYWNETNDNTFSLVASQILATDNDSTFVAPTNVFSCTNFTNTFYVNKLIAEKGWSGNGKVADGSFAVASVKGGAEVYEKYGDEYYVNVVDVPTATVEDVCKDVLCVSSFTRDSARTMEIMTLINTNSEFRTILQYGVEGIHWKYTDETKSTITKLDGSYVMKLEETGNGYITYPDYGVSKEYWDYAKAQNLASHTDPYTYYEDTIAESVASIQKGITKTQTNINNKQKEIDNLKAQIAKADALSKQALNDELTSAQKSLTSYQNSLASAQFALTTVKALATDSASYWKEINKMSAADFKAAVDNGTLVSRTNLLYSVGYMLSEEDYDCYSITKDTKALYAKSYYLLKDFQFSRASIVVNADISGYSDLYELNTYSASYSVLASYIEFYKQTFGD